MNGVVMFSTGIVLFLFVAIREILSRKTSEKEQRRIDFESRQRQKKLDNQRNVNNRLFNALRSICFENGLGIEKEKAYDRDILHIFRSEEGPLFGQHTIIFVILSFLDEEEKSIFVRYNSSSNCDRFGSSEEQILCLIDALSDHISNQTVPSPC